MAVVKLKDVADMPPEASATVKVCGNVAVVTCSKRGNHAPAILKVSKEYYVNLTEGTGELHEFKHNESRLDDKLSVKESLSRLRDYINTNAVNVSKCRWLTLTYAENMTDTQKLYADFKAFNRKCRKEYGHYEYITAAEPQGRGAWHLHCLLIFDDKAPYMENKTVAALWGKGFVNIRKLTNVDDVGRYLTAYLGDMTLDELGRLPANMNVDRLKVITVAENGGKSEKAIIKGARMALYPSGFNLYRISKGIKPPEILRMTKEEAEQAFFNWALTYEAVYEVSDENRNGFKNIILKRYYNRLRNKKRGAENE